MLFKTIGDVIRLLSGQGRFQALTVLAVLLGMALSEVLGVASVMPFLAVAADPELIRSNEYLAFAFRWLGFESARGFLTAMGVAFLSALLLSLAVRAVGSKAILSLASSTGVAWSAELFSHLLHQPYDLYLTQNSSQLSSTILYDVDVAVNEVLVPALMMTSQAIISGLLLALLVAMDPFLAISVGGLIGGGFLLTSLATRRRLSRMSAERHAAHRARHRIVQDAFLGFKEIKLGALEVETVDGFNVPSRVRARMQLEATYLSQLPALAMQGLLFGGILTVLLYLIQDRGSLAAALPIAGLYAFAGYRLMPALQKVFEESGKIRLAQPSVATLTGLLVDSRAAMSQQRGGDQKTESIAFTSSVPTIGLQEVTYRYRGTDRFAVRRVSLNVPACASIGFVGSTGSGKSTLIDVILGLLSPQEGAVLIDGIALRSPALVRAWQCNIGYVPQQIFLSDDTIRANIAFGVPASLVDEERVIEAAKAACLHDFIVAELPAGYRTMVGDRGTRLSGGQRQRLGIARALYRRPKVLVFDEATSALDNITEQNVMKTVGELRDTMTVIMIAHRLSTVQRCDTIFVLEHGEVVEQGSYDMLVETSPSFRRMALLEDEGQWQDVSGTSVKPSAQEVTPTGQNFRIP